VPTVRRLTHGFIVAAVVVAFAVWYFVGRQVHAPSPGDDHTPPAGAPAASVRGGVRPSPAPAADAAAPRRDLSRDEARGGHTLARHVARSDDELRARLAREPGIGAASSYTDRRTAEHVVGAALEQARDRVDAWSQRSGRRPNLALDYRGQRSAPVGKSLRRGDRAPRQCADAVVVLRWDTGRDDYYVLTSYPECR
jgi:hypothetical protein